MKPIAVVVKFMVVWETGCYFFVGPLLVDKFVGCDHGALVRDLMGDPVSVSRGSSRRKSILFDVSCIE
jgi:hypothetical protein